MIGGIAGTLQGSWYPTYDLDVAYARDKANMKSLSGVLDALDVKLNNAPEDLPFMVDERTLSNGANFTSIRLSGVSTSSVAFQGCPLTKSFGVISKR